MKIVVNQENRPNLIANLPDGAYATKDNPSTVMIKAGTQVICLGTNGLRVTTDMREFQLSYLPVKSLTVEI